MSSLVVDTNLSALAANNALNATDSNMTKAIQQLSTGLAIQTAADGPAAYVQSQALQSQANGYQAAISNAQDGVSLVQTASGALNQISSILQTMNQLALNSANGATQDPTSLQANQQEFSALQQDITQIASTTSYGTTNLLDGSFSSVLQVGAFDNANQQINLQISSATAQSLGVGPGQASVKGATAISAGVAVSAAGSVVTLDLSLNGGASVAVTVNLGVTATSATTVAASTVVADVNSALQTAGLSNVTAALNSSGDLTLTSLGATIAVGAASTLGLSAASASTLTGAVSVGTVSAAQSAISAVQAAIGNVDSIEANVGAIQNQLQAIAANLTVGQQNLTAANSQLVDVNMAQEMTTFSTDQILMQTGTAMLAQAQQAPQLVLKLI